MDSMVLLQAVAGVARAVRSLYGSRKLRKQVTDELDQTLFSADAYTVASALQSQNAGTAVLQQALNVQRRGFGTGCTTMLSLCGVLVEAVLELQRHGLPVDVIQEALSCVERCSLKTAKHMRIPLAEACPFFNKLPLSSQLATLGRLLSTNNEIATDLAVQAASLLDPIRFCGDEDLSVQDLVTTHVVLGGVTSAASSRVLGGVLLPIADAASCYCLRRRFSADCTIAVNSGVAVIAGDLETTEFAANSSVQTIFVYGEISTNVLDVSGSMKNAALCVPVSSFNALKQLAEMSGAEIVDSWEELLPSAIGSECLQLKELDLSVSRAQEDDEDDEFATYFVQVQVPDVSSQPHASVIVQGPTKSLAVELRNDTRKMICRLRNALRSRQIIPGNGGFWCACAAAIALKAETLAASKLELLSFATARLADPFTQLSAILLENTSFYDPKDAAEDSFLSRLMKVRKVQKSFARGVQNVDVDKFYSCYYDFCSAEYAVLSLKTKEPESEDGRNFHADEYKAMSSAIQGAFRVIQLLLNIDQHHVN